jgi:hypothetical protein
LQAVVAVAHTNLGVTEELAVKVAEAMLVRVTILQMQIQKLVAGRL